MFPSDSPSEKSGGSGTSSSTPNSSSSRKQPSVKKAASPPKSLPMQDTITLIYSRGSTVLLKRTIPFSPKGARLLSKALERAEEASRQAELPF